MWCLVPQFNCVPDTLSFFHCKPPKSRELICYRIQCSISVASPPVSTPTTTVLDLEKLRLLSSESYATERPWTYTGALGPSTEAGLGTTLPRETLLTSEEATVAAAAEEALALAKAALKLAKDAAKMMGPAILDEKPSTTISEDNNIIFSRAELAEIGEADFSETLQSQASLKDAVDQDPTSQELELLEAQLTSSIAVRSNRQTERKAKRTRAAEKAAVGIVTVKSGSTSRKKRTTYQEIDHSDPLRFIRATTSSSKLLTATEEQELSAAVQDMMKLDALQGELSERFGCEPTFAQWAEAANLDEKTLRKRLTYGTMCKDKMIKSNIRLVVSIAKNYQGVGLSFQDLVQEGCRGLVRGCEKFDASKGFKFSTYAHWWIKQAIRKSLSDRSRTIRLPFHMVDATYRVKEAKKQLFKENGRQPNNEEVAEATGLSMKKLETVLLTPKAPRSLDQKIGFNMDLKPSDVIADPEAATCEEILMKQFMKKDLEKVLGTLNPREKQVIRWRFGLDDGRMKTLQEIGELMGVSRERVRQIESCAFRKLKSKKRTKHLQQYVVS